MIDGDVNAFEALVERYRKQVFGIVARRIPYDRVEEVAHDAFVRAYESLPSFRGNSPFGNWLSKIVARSCYDFWREQYKRKEVLSSSLGEDQEEWLDSVLAVQSSEAFEREAAAREAAEVLNYALAKLSAEDRTVLTMVHLEGLSVRETADLLGWSVVRVKVRAHRSRNQLRKVVAGLLQERGEKR